MQPKVWMTVFATFECGFLLLLAATGRDQAAIVTALGWSAACAAFALVYKLRQRRSKRPLPTHRRALDRVVLAQWALAPAFVGLVVALFDVDILRDTGRFLDAATVASVVAGLGIYVSAAVDWYLILPSVSGIVRAAPCQAPGRERWATLSKLWFFHRGAATIVVILCIVGLFAYMAATAGQAGHDSEQLVWLGAIALVGAVFYRYQHRALTALWWGLRAPRHVGDIVTLEDGSLAYIVDLAVQGANYMRLNNDRTYSGAKFPYKKDDDVPLEFISRLKPHNPPGSTELRAPCSESSRDCSPAAEWCSGVNWYCRCNPDAHG